MVIGVGIDIVEIGRIQEQIEKYGEQFLNKVYTEKEIEYCSVKANKYQHYAARFAAKEAVIKALADEDIELGLKNIEVFNEPTGKPIIIFNGAVETYLSRGREVKISLTHSREYAACVAVISKL